MDSLLFELDQEFLSSMGIVSVDALLPSTKEGKVLVPFKNYFSVAADLVAGTCIGNITIVTSSEGSQADPEKTSGVTSYPTSTGINEIRSFLGLANHYCRFVP